MKELNESQQDAFEEAIKYPFSLCQGETGKSYLIVNFIQYWLQSNQQNRILVCTHSNKATKIFRTKYKKVNQVGILYLNKEDETKGEGDAKNSNNARIVFNTVSFSFKIEPGLFTNNL